LHFGNIKKRDRNYKALKQLLRRMDKLTLAFLGIRKVSNNHSCQKKDLNNILVEVEILRKLLKKTYDEFR
jgi:hypothetical protein